MVCNMKMIRQVKLNYITVLSISLTDLFSSWSPSSIFFPEDRENDERSSRQSQLDCKINKVGKSTTARGNECDDGTKLFIYNLRIQQVYRVLLADPEEGENSICYISCWPEKKWKDVMHYRGSLPRYGKVTKTTPRQGDVRSIELRIFSSTHKNPQK